MKFRLLLHSDMFIFHLLYHPSAHTETRGTMLRPQDLLAEQMHLSPARDSTKTRKSSTELYYRGKIIRTEQKTTVHRKAQL